MIWNYIRDFLVQNIFGGMDSDGVFFAGAVGSGSINDFFDTSNVFYECGKDYDLNPVYLSLGDWLSTTCTIVIMVAIVILFALLVRWVYRAVTSAFLLR